MHNISPNLNIKSPTKPDYSNIYTSPNYQIKTFGECNQGTYVKIYIPDNPYYKNDHIPQAVIYLHGFALGASEIYSTHLEHLVKQGYYVIYPNYQRGFCEFSGCLLKTILQLSEEILYPFPISPQTWINSAIHSAINAYQQVNLFTQNVDTYLFGHSLGGLFALSWNYSAQNEVPVNMLPKQIVVADPIPASDSNIPSFVRSVINKLGGFKDQVNIQETGVGLNVPIAILHGNEDTVIPKQDWVTPFNQFIASPQKKMYLSFTDQHGLEPMYANHEQATIDTSFFPNFLAKAALDGVGRENNLNWRYIWDALDQVIRFGARADELQFHMGEWSDGQPVKPIQVYL